MSTDSLTNLLQFLVNLLLVHLLFFHENRHEKQQGRNNFLLFLLVLVLLIVSWFDRLAGLSVGIFLIATLLMMLISANKYGLPLKKALFWWFLFFNVSIFTEHIASFVLHLLFPFRQGFVYNKPHLWLYLGLAASLKLLAILCLKIIVFHKQKQQRAIRLSFIFSLITILSFSGVMFFFFTIGSTQSHATTVTIIIAFLFLTICIVHLYVMFVRYSEELLMTSIRNHTLETEIKFFQQVKKSQHQVQALRHDLKNQYLVLSGMLAEGAVEEAQRYLERSMVKITTYENFYTHDHGLNYLLNEKITLARQADVTMDTHIVLPKNMRIDNDILAIVIGNLLDNSLQAVARLPEKTDRKIKILIKQTERNLKIKISNTFDPQECQTRSARKIKGIGVKNIQRIIKENNGIYKHWTQENEYHSQILLFNTSVATVGNKN